MARQCGRVSGHHGWHRPDFVLDSSEQGDQHIEFRRELLISLAGITNLADRVRPAAELDPNDVVPKQEVMA